jgi:hypothetical protein
VLETKDLLHVCVQKFLGRERGKCWNWRTSRYVPIGTRRKERFHMCLQRERGKCWKRRPSRNEYMCLLGETERREKKRKESEYLVEDLYFILRI